MVKKYDGEYPNKYLKDVLDYLEISENEFNDLCDKFRSPHLWVKLNGKYKLRHTVNCDGHDD